MWLMLQQEKPEDFVIATGVTTTVRDFVRKAFNIVGIELTFEGENENEIAKVKACNNPAYQLEIGTTVVRVDPRYFRPTEVDLLIGDATKAHQKLGWKPKYDLDSLVEEMVLSDVELFKRN
jgi:GDPmannose 4,6-dehydratase